MTEAWSENDSASFIRFAGQFVPDRAEQLAVVSKMIGPLGDGVVLDLCSGTGELSHRILADHSRCRIIGLDGSDKMLAESRRTLAAFGDRYRPERFDLGATHWRKQNPAPTAVVSSLAIHHLDGSGKNRLYRDVFNMLRPGGMFVVADLFFPSSEPGRELARRMWDEWVRANALASGLGEEPYKAFHALEWSWLQYPDELDKPSPLVDQLRWLGEIGFVEVDVYWLKAGHAIFGGRRLGGD